MSIARLTSGTSVFLPMSKIREDSGAIQLLDSTNLGVLPYHNRFHLVETVCSSGNTSYRRTTVWKIGGGEDKPPYHL
jgi:hypothetical protein